MAAVAAERLDRAALADDLAVFLSGLHGVAPALAAEVVRPGPDPAEAWLEQVGEEYAEAPPTSTRTSGPVEAFLAAAPPPPARDLVFCHNDVRTTTLIWSTRAPDVSPGSSTGATRCSGTRRDLATVSPTSGPRCWNGCSLVTGTPARWV